MGFAAFWASNFSATFPRFPGLKLHHLFGVVLGHFFKEGYESVAASFTRQIGAFSLTVGSNVPFRLTI